MKVCAHEHVGRTAQPSHGMAPYYDLAHCLDCGTDLGLWRVWTMSPTIVVNGACVEDTPANNAELVRRATSR